nr:OmpH family outer membrane protein [Capnocytophaga felis]
MAVGKLISFLDSNSKNLARYFLCNKNGRTRKSFLAMIKLKHILLSGLFLITSFIFAQKGVKIGYVDMDFILSNLEEYKVANEQFALQVNGWQLEIEKRQKQIQDEKDKLEAEKSLLTAELIKDKQQEIDLLEHNLNAYKEQKFGAEKGEYVTQKFMLAKPIQDQVFNIVQEIGKLRKYDMIFEKSEVSMLYSNNQHNLTNVVLRILRRKDNAEDRNKEIGELLKESYDFEFVDERTKKRKELEQEKERKKAEYEKEKQKRIEETQRKRAEEQAQKEKEKAERQQKQQEAKQKKNK